LLLALLAAGIWLRVRNQGVPQLHEAKINSTPTPVEEKKPEPTIPKSPVVPQSAVAVNKHRPRPVAPALSKQEHEEALVAKEQLMMALRLTTEKLSLVHHRNPNTTPANQIKNQHRVG
jgi:hypothetical protein